MIHTLLIVAQLLIGLSMSQDTGRIELTVTTTYALDYLISVPEDYDPQGDPLPLVLFLHGAGERGDDLNLVKKHGPPKMIEEGRAFPAIVVSPQCPTDSWWDDQVPALIALLDKIEGQYHIDRDREYLTGLSMGGYGTFALGAAQPNRFAALVPICGGGSRFVVHQLTHMPMWVFHGEADHVVPPEESLRLVQMLRAQGNRQVRLTTYPGVDHDSWTQTYANPEMWDWMFAQRRSARQSKD